jgi:hypothetical protein
MFCAPGLVFGGTDGVGSRFHVFRPLNRFRRYRGRHVHFSCCTLHDSFSAVTSASGPVFMFCVPGLVFCGTEGVGYRFHFVPALTRFRRNRGLRVPFSCFARLFSFSAVSRASGPFLMFCAPGLVFDGTKGMGSCFHFLRFRTSFRRCRVRRVPFSCFACPDSFSAVPRVSGPVFMFYAP